MELIDLFVANMAGKNLHESLPDGKAVPFDLEESNGEHTIGGIVEGFFPENYLDLLLYLQTLSFYERKVGGIPDIMEVEAAIALMKEDEISALPDRHPKYVRIHAAGVIREQRSDIWQRIIMLERLIVEIVRRCAPSESQRLRVRYRVNSNGKIRRVTIFEPKFIEGIVDPT